MVNSEVFHRNRVAGIAIKYQFLLFICVHTAFNVTAYHHTDEETKERLPLHIISAREREYDGIHDIKYTYLQIQIAA